ncbi:MAG: 3-dehydroquinate synthase [Armatimonadetes bacterium]|nr:3-dehydroquinate synthase [Armatimonadota bacterium]
MTVAPEATYRIAVSGPPPYPVYLEEGLALRCGALFAEHGVKRAVLVSNPVVGSLHGAAVRNAIREAGVEVDSLEVPDGEAYKSVSTATHLWESLADLQADRNTTLVALGGGVVGDVVGFAAATYARGIPYVHIPTTVLSMVDSSIGGKVGVDLPQGKNLVGAFYNPLFVVTDPGLLMSLPPRQFSSGMAEVVKAACVASSEFFAALEAREPALGPQDLDQIIAQAIHIKTRVVSEDPFERGPRATLNLGHTLGHALEAARGFHPMLHGEAVSLGMLAALRIARATGVLEEDYEARLTDLLERLRLPTRIQDAGWSRVVAALGVDKKRADGHLRFVLPVKLGQVVVREVSLDTVHEVYEGMLALHAEDEAVEPEDEYEREPEDREPAGEPLDED